MAKETTISIRIDHTIQQKIDLLKLVFKTQTNTDVILKAINYVYSFQNKSLFFVRVNAQVIDHILENKSKWVSGEVTPISFAASLWSNRDDKTINEDNLFEITFLEYKNVCDQSLESFFISVEDDESFL